jgi:hypothetical protein
MRIPIQGLRLALVLCSLMFVAGCSSNQHLGNGIVRFSDGEPVKSGTVEFRGLENGDRYASRIDEQGQFQLVNGNGLATIPDGDYEVVVVQIVLTEDLALAQHQHGRTVPRRFADYYTSEIRVSVDHEQPDPIHIVIATQ